MRTHVWRRSFVRLSQLHKPLPVQRRAFHAASRRLTQHPPPPPPPSGPPTSGTGDGSQHDATGLDKDARRKAHEENAEEIRRGRLSQRRGRVYSKAPKEVPAYTIPPWFLDYNVRLHETTTTTRQRPAHAATRTFTLVDRDTGHVVLTLPFVQHVTSDSQPTASSSKPDSSKDSTDSKGLTDSTDSTDSTDALTASFFSPTGSIAAHDVTLPPPTALPSTGTDQKDAIQTDAAQEDAFQQGAAHQEDAFQQGAAHQDTAHTDAKRAAKQLSPSPPTSPPNPRLLMYLQVQLLLQAAFSTAGPASSRISRPNIELHTSAELAHNDAKDVDDFVQDVANLMSAHLIRLDANDLSELAADYIDTADPAYPSPSISTLPYDVYKGAGAPTFLEQDDPSDDFAAEDSQDSPHLDPTDRFDDPFASSPLAKIDIAKLGKFFQNNANKLSKALDSQKPIAINMAALGQMSADHSASDNPSNASSAFTITSWEELKLQTLLDTLLDAPTAKKDQPTRDYPKSAFQDSFHSSVPSDQSTNSSQPPQEHDFADMLKDFLTMRINPASKNHSIIAALEVASSSPSSSRDPPPPTEEVASRTILHIRDLEAIRNTPQGEAIVRLLDKVIQRRRKDGQQIVMIGTSPTSNSPFIDDISQDDGEAIFRTVHYLTNASDHSSNAQPMTFAPLTPSRPYRSVATTAYKRVLEINMRNIRSMIHRLGLPVSDALFDPQTRSHLNIPGTTKLGNNVLSHDQVQQIVFYAESLRTIYSHSPRLETFHIAFATALKDTIENALRSAVVSPMDPVIPPVRPRGSSKGATDSSKRGTPKVNIEQLKKTCDKHEKKLLGGVVDPQNLKTTFADVHAPADTIDALKTLTSLSLLRPEAFSYGVLANDRLPGLLLYGPPGTGKTMLAKAVAKESCATVLEVSGAQVYEKYVGEGEKMVKAVFSLAKKLSPCVVFIDEADALFGSRGGANNRTTHREIINQFLREWDGMDDHSVFMMVATNRPFDLDDAVLRRLPRRLLVDLPVAKDRESILGIHLKGETLDSTVSLNKLAEDTPLYSGSDLKNVCVAAALAAVREENDLLAQNKDNKDFKLPERRTLTDKHFEKALAEISASISEDMSSLGAIRKFDEQYGDRRAKRKKTSYGFGVTGSEVDERAARVRQDDQRR